MARDHSYYPQYVPVSARKERNKKAAAKLKKKKDIQHISISGRKIAKTWWGEHWCENLERYADYSNRIGRGRSYVRHGAVLDLRIAEGEIKAAVKGSRATPYEVVISIQKLVAGKWNKLCKASAKSVESLADLLGGEFPKELKSLFFDSKDGIYPAPQEISFECSCPDWASMCKHVAAALYGVGRRLDDRPDLLFVLRSVSVEKLVDKTLTDSTDNLMEKADAAAGGDVMKDADLESVFGIEMDQSIEEDVDLPSVEDCTGDAGDEEPAEEATARAKETPPPDTRRDSSRKGRSNNNSPVLNHFLEAVSNVDGTFSKPDIRPLFPDWAESKVTNTLYRAHRKGHLERVSTGVYKYIGK
ncbi:MAG: hypothetical protein ACOC0A_02960 [Planctomycetota bacterium]